MNASHLENMFMPEPRAEMTGNDPADRFEDARKVAHSEMTTARDDYCLAVAMSEARGMGWPWIKIVVMES